MAPPTPAIISLASTDQVQFNCTAMGHPTLEIAWRHNGVEVTSTSRYHVTQSMPTSNPQGPEFVSTGTFSISTLNETDAGWVECVVGVVFIDEMTEGEEILRDVRGTRLSVLGERGGASSYSLGLFYFINLYT